MQERANHSRAQQEDERMWPQFAAKGNLIGISTEMWTWRHNLEQLAVRPALSGDVADDFQQFLPAEIIL